MKTLLILAFAISFLPSAGYLRKEVPADPPKVETPAPAEGVFKIEIKELKGFSKVQEARFRKIAEKTEGIVRSEEFKNRVLSFKNRAGVARFHDTPDSNAKVLEKINRPWALEYRLEYMRWGTSAIGYTYPDVTWIAINARKFDYLSDAEIAANISHEQGCHKVGGYDHSFRWNEDRDFSVPYGVGSIVEKLYGK
jgi:hypothetical protein